MKPIYGVIHLPNLRFYSKHSLEEVIEKATHELSILEDTGFTGAIIENFFDAPFAKNQVTDEVFAKISIICNTLRRNAKFDLGLNILRNANKQAMTIASICNFQFIRSNIWEGAYVTDQGIIETQADKVYDEKHRLASSVKIFADIHVKHASPFITSSILESANHALDRGGADEIIISGPTTGKPIAQEDLVKLYENGYMPLIGSGLTATNLEQLGGKIKGGIVGTALKERIDGPILENNARDFIQAWQEVFD